MYVSQNCVRKMQLFQLAIRACRGKIVWADQQKTVKRLKRDYISLADLESEKPLTREKRLQLNAYGAALNAVNSEEEIYDVASKTRMFNDELWDQEWYLVIKLSNLRVS